MQLPIYSLGSHQVYPSKSADHYKSSMKLILMPFLDDMSIDLANLSMHPEKYSDCLVKQSIAADILHSTSLILWLPGIANKGMAHFFITAGSLPLVLYHSVWGGGTLHYYSITGSCIAL